MIAAKSERQAELLRLLTLTKRLQRGPGFYKRLQESVPPEWPRIMPKQRITLVLPGERIEGANA